LKKNNRDSFFKYLAQTSPIPLSIEITHSEGNYLYDAAGKKYLDFISGIAVSNTGHRQASVVDAIKAQAGKYLHTLVYGEFILEPQVRLAELLCRQLPSTLNNVYFLNSGSEAVEAAIKLARRYTGRTGIIAFDHAYHGSTTGSLSLAGDDWYKDAFRPLLPGVKILPFNDTAALKEIDDTTAAVFAEPIQGEAGAVPATNVFLHELREKCRQTASLLVFDEIQSGMGRTGSLFAFEQYACTPDILLLGKALGGGLPLSALIASKQIMDVFQDNPVLGHITTFGGNPLCCAAGYANLEFLLKSNLMSEVPAKEALIRKLLHHPSVKEIRGKGLMLAAELGSFEAVRKTILQCLDKGLILDWFLFNNTAIRLAPPLTITQEEIAFACNTLVEALGG
jgi:acetylornithine/succinyldiaminopimelate/putrescine aminotransferase